MDNLFKGVWELEQWVEDLTDGRHVFPFGKDAVGRLAYDGEGHMSVQIMKVSRFAFQSDNLFQGQPEEMIEAYKSFIGYAGTYDIAPDKEEITHHIQVSSYPNWAGQEQVRQYRFTEEGKLILTARLEFGVHHLTWRKLH